MRDLRWLATLHVPGKEEIHYLVVIPAKAKLRSQQARSLDWFLHRERERAFGSRGAMWHTVYRQVHYTELQFVTPTEERTSKELLEQPGLKVFNNIWDFYQAIGYDYKKKKYLVEQELAKDSKEFATALIKRASQLLEFDKEHCDFGPSLGLHEQDKQEWQKDVAAYLRAVKETDKNQGR